MSKLNIFFTIIIPTFNSEKTIEKTLKSILKQTYKEFEIIIFDNNSKDKTIEIINSFSDARIKLFQEKDEGMYFAINKALYIANGLFVTYCNSDDYYLENNLLFKIHKKILLENFDLDLLLVGGLFIKGIKKKKIEPKKYSKKDYIFLGMPTLQNGFFWKLSNDKFDTKFKICSDYDFFSRFFFREKKIKILNFLGAGFVSSENSLGSKNHLLGLNETKIIQYNLMEKISLNKKFYPLYKFLYLLKKIL